jgi:ferrous iron transport protein B
VLTLLPILVVFFAALALLEDVGYLARAAYMMDRFMHPMGLHGKSCLALCIGFGCNVPAVLEARVVESERPAADHPIGSSGTVRRSSGRAGLPHPDLLPAQPSSGLLEPSCLQLAGLGAIGVIANRVLFHGEGMAFIMELPLYHWPNLRTISLQVWHRSLAFLRHAGTIILVVSTLVWMLASIPGPTIEASLLAGLGRLLTPLGRLMGLDWRMMVALMTSFIAKENTIDTLGMLYHAGEGAPGLVQALVGDLSPVAALAFLVVQMLFIPCVATVAVMHQEQGSWRWTIFSIALLLMISFGTGIVIYQGVTFLNG